MRWSHAVATSFRESILFTHRGLSGPAILQISSYWKKGDIISIDLAPTIDAESFLRDRKRARPKAELKTILAEILPEPPRGSDRRARGSDGESSRPQSSSRWRSG